MKFSGPPALPVQLLAVLLLASGCPAEPAVPVHQEGPCHLKVAFFGALTGNDANIALAPRDGARLAVYAYNAANPACRVELVDADSRGDPRLAPAVAERLVGDPAVLAVIGPAFSGESEAATPVFDAAGITTITPSATRTSLAEQGWRVFHRVVGNDAAQGPAAGWYIKHILRAGKAYVVNDVGAYGKGLADEVRKELGSLVIRTATVQPGQTDVELLAADIAASGADVVFFGGYYTEAGGILRRMRQIGITATFVSGDGSRDPGLIELAGPRSAEGTVLTCPCLPPERARDNFSARFTAAFGTSPGIYAAEAYDAAQILLSGIQAGNRTRSSLLAYVNAYDGDGVTGRIRFDSRGELPKESMHVWSFRVLDGTIAADREITID